MVDYTELISKMTDEEKASLCSGADFWHTKGVARLGIPQMMLTDGPHGLRKQIGKNDHLGLNAAYPATCFPTASAAANSWDEAMIEQMGRRLGAETRTQRVGVILGPGVNIKRSPLCGRNLNTTPRIRCWPENVPQRSYAACSQTASPLVSSTLPQTRRRRCA